MHFNQQPHPSPDQVLIGIANDIELFKNDPQILMLIADRARRYVREEMGVRS